MSPLALQPRPFPPPTLTDVPVEYIFDQLRNLAPYYWNKPETADCTIVIPVPNNRPRPLQALSTPESAAEHAARRRAMEYAFNSHPAHPPIVLKLHVDYLTARSTFLRGLFTGKSPHELLQDFRRTSSSGTAPSSPPPIPPSRLPRVLPNSPPGHPIVVLPVPDPASIHLVFYWMYHGKTRSLEDCLAQGIVEWEGVARNVEYLGLPSEIKIFLGRWYGNWLLPNPARDEIVANPFGEDDDDDESDDDDDDDGFSADESGSEMSCGEDDGMPPRREILERGRNRAVRPLARGHPPRP
ncbi:hypothetical protein CONPUDRAFT_134717 [Coniophora puteana RWD-64-598 SS2]|uniref:Uncharacterized protein n=1 Tax=Coniophora puteana (strain RWD-64-598) TaxID=741705 RepID=A0A5M3N0F2_CONPW|nr:uncharacterized protein CONPUDRAFT_134717 [Coniophora puteana RWD-64-598 SS2]EIW84848.1 hypothetical protein CONPUDRAFT_134717 [Coniophora puteana RWD-64-598 SS2]